MGAHVITIDSVSRNAARESAVADGLVQFTKALAAVKNMNALSVVETKSTLDSWHAAGILTDAEHRALFEFYGWERG